LVASYLLLGLKWEKDEKEEETPEKEHFRRSRSGRRDQNNVLLEAQEFVTMQYWHTRHLNREGVKRTTKK